MILEVLEGQTKGGYFSYSIFDPSVNQCTVPALYLQDHNNALVGIVNRIQLHH